MVSAVLEQRVRKTITMIASISEAFIKTMEQGTISLKRAVGLVRIWVQFNLNATDSNGTGTCGARGQIPMT